uniref:Fibronectin type-III domain-containing protein n=2 Tax=Onchocerca ochengi TaxID=42157 RepID=A0A182EXU0_ONCOC
MQLHMFANTGVQTYSLHSHTIQLGTIYKISYFLGNRRWRGMTSQRFQTEAEIVDGFHDDVICAKIPDPDIDKDLYEIVTKNMIHGPCGTLNPKSPCMIDRKCSKQSPRALISNTITGNDGYPLYRRRSAEDGGKLANIHMWNGDIEVDN